MTTSCSSSAGIGRTLGRQVLGAGEVWVGVLWVAGWAEGAGLVARKRPNPPFGAASLGTPTEARTDGYGHGGVVPMLTSSQTWTWLAGDLLCSGRERAAVGGPTANQNGRGRQRHHATLHGFPAGAPPTLSRDGGHPPGRATARTLRPRGQSRLTSSPARPRPLPARRSTGRGRRRTACTRQRPMPTRTRCWSCTPGTRHPSCG